MESVVKFLLQFCFCHDKYNLIHLKTRLQWKKNQNRNCKILQFKLASKIIVLLFFMVATEKQYLPQLSYFYGNRCC